MKSKDTKLVKKELSELDESLRFKENLIVGITSGVTVVILFDIIDYLTGFGVLGFGLFALLVFILSKLFLVKEKKKLANLNKLIKNKSS